MANKQNRQPNVVNLVCVNNYGVSLQTKKKYSGEMVYLEGKQWRTTSRYDRATHFAVRNDDNKVIRTSIYRFMPV